MPYRTLKDGEGFEVEDGEIIKFACCDCGLIHDMAFAIEENGKIGVAMRRNKRATAGRRRGRLFQWWAKFREGFSN